MVNPIYPLYCQLTEVLKPPCLKKSSTKSTLCHSPTSSLLFPLGDLQPASPIMQRSSSASTRVRHMATSSATRSKPTRLSPIGITAGSMASLAAISPPDSDDLLESFENAEILTSPGASSVSRLKSPNQYTVQRQSSDPSEAATETLESILRCSRRRWDLLPLTEASKPPAEPHRSLLVNKPSSLRRLLSNDNLINASCCKEKNHSTTTSSSNGKPPIFPVSKMAAAKNATSSEKPIGRDTVTSTSFSRHTSVLSGLIRGTHKYSTDASSTTKLMVIIK